MRKLLLLLTLSSCGAPEVVRSCCGVRQADRKETSPGYYGYSCGEGETQFGLLLQGRLWQLCAGCDPIQAAIEAVGQPVVCVR